MNIASDHLQREGFESALRTIAGSAPGKEQIVFSEFAKQGLRHALLAGVDKTDAADRLDNAGAALGLDPDFRQQVLCEAISLATARDAVDEIFANLERAPPTATNSAAVAPLSTMTPIAWKGTEAAKQRWLAHARIPLGDLTIGAGNGGAGKTEIFTQLIVAVAAMLGDWLGCVVEPGTALFLSCEEPEANIRDRIERFCKHRDIDPHAIENLHLHFPDLEETWLVTVDRSGRVLKTPLFLALENWIATNKPRLVVIDSIAAVFDGEAIARRQVRSFLAMLRKMAREHDTAIVLLDHPSVRGMADGSGTSNSVDWRNSVRSMLHLSGPDKEDQDVRQLETKKSNYGRSGEKVTLRWNGLTFVTDNLGSSSPYRAAAEQNVDDLFLRLLDKRNAQGRQVRPSTGRGYAPAELAKDPEAAGVAASAFAAAMERLFTSGKIVTITTGPKSRQSTHIERA